jgi:chorismate synthase
MLRFEDLKVMDQFRQVAQLEEEVWGPVDLVPVPILAVTVHRGAVLVGAYDDDRLVGFIYSFPALKRGLAGASHWSHMLAVSPSHRGGGLGRQLKLVQRERVLSLGIDLIEWTFDPLQTENAHLNFVKLGVVADEYEENIYGESPSPLHGGLPTDRLVCQWWIRSPQVVRRLEAHELPVVGPDVLEAAIVNPGSMRGDWWACGGVDLSHDDPRVRVEIPRDFTGMLAADPGLARAWRLESRAVFQHYFARGYRAVDFMLDRTQPCGRYLLVAL